MKTSWQEYGEVARSYSSAPDQTIFPALWASDIEVIAGNSDWFIALFAPVVIGRSNYFDTAFSTVNVYPYIKWFDLFSVLGFVFAI